MRRYAVDRVLVLRFNEKFSQRSADDFILNLLVNGLGVKYLVVGDDFRFGKERVGDFAPLEGSTVSRW